MPLVTPISAEQASDKAAQTFDRMSEVFEVTEIPDFSVHGQRPGVCA